MVNVFVSIFSMYESQVQTGTTLPINGYVQYREKEA